MKRLNSLLVVAVVSSGMFFSCGNENENIAPGHDVPEEVMSKLTQLGFNLDGLSRFEDGYLVENDIYLTDSDLERMAPGKSISVVEQYSTNNLVSGPRVINVYMPTGSRGFSAGEQAGLDEAMRRYNAEGLTISFQRVSDSRNADIVFKRLSKRDESRGVLGSAGFPTASGDPYGTINMSGILESRYGLSVDGIATIMAHEMGHCIGFRHTDYYDRSVSCGGSTANEGDGGIGANHIPGTPTTADLAGNGSWMLACTDGSNRPFTNYDKVALDYLY